MAATGIWAQQQIAQTLYGRATPMAGPGSTNNNGNNGSNNSTNSATISANDFLTLLVTEMQNQDPTDETDPNEYIDQLVQVNSLEQLIDINQNLATALGDPSGGTGASGTAIASPAQVPGAAAGLAPTTSTGAPAVLHPAANKTSALGEVQSAAAAGSVHARGVHGVGSAVTAPGNLSIPDANPAAQRVAHALSGHGIGK